METLKLITNRNQINPQIFCQLKRQKLLQNFLRERVKLRNVWTSLVSMFSQANLYFMMWEGLEIVGKPRFRSVAKCDVAEALSILCTIHPNYFRCSPQLYCATLQTCARKTRIIFFFLPGCTSLQSWSEPQQQNEQDDACDVAGFSLFRFFLSFLKCFLRFSLMKSPQLRLALSRASPKRFN